MALEKITMRLSPFEKLQVLRRELDERTKDMESVERDIRSALNKLEIQRYLEGLSPYYAAQGVIKGGAAADGKLPTSGEIAAMEERRNQLASIISIINEQIPLVLQQTSGQEPPADEQPAASAAPARKARFDTF